MDRNVAADVDAGLRAVTARLGRFHWVMCSLLSVAYVYQSLFTMAYIFTTLRSEHRCWVPECETQGSAADLQPPWLWLAVPAVPGPAADSLVADPCRRWQPLPQPGGEARCDAHSFSNSSVQCDRRVYPDRELSIMTEWDMACSAADEWRLALVGSANGLGRALGLPLFGLASDALGRRAAALAAMAVSCVLGTARSFAPDYATFVALEFLDPLFYDGIGGAAFIMGMELMPPATRGAWSAVSHVVSALGLGLLGLAAWLLPRWRPLLRVLYGSGLLCLAALWCVPESARWLASKGRAAEAFVTINRAARMNGLPPPLPPPPLDLERAPKRPGQQQLDEAAASAGPSFATDLKEFLRSRILVLRLVTCCACWIAIMLVYEGLAVYSVSLAGDRYLSFILVELVEVPAAIITWKAMAVAGRRSTLVWSLVPAAACSVAYHFLAAAAPWTRTAAVVLAKLHVTVAYTATYVLSAELFPTRVRHTMYALAATSGRLGSALAPQMPLLAAVMESLPMLVFGAVCACTALLALSFPETTRAALPDTVAQAEAIGKEGQPRRGRGRGHQAG